MANARLLSSIIAGAALLGAAGAVLAQAAAPAAPGGGGRGGGGAAPAAGAPAAAAAAGGRGGAPGGGGRGPAGPPGFGTGGSNNIPRAQWYGEALFNTNCSSCHGTEKAAGTAPSAFSTAVMQSHTPWQLSTLIKNGAKGMPGFKDKLNDTEVLQIADYLRQVNASLTPPAPFFANPDGHVIHSEKQTFKVELVADGLMTPWGESFLPDGRLLVTERDGRLRIISKDGKLDPNPVAGAPVPHVQQDGGYLDVAVGPNYKNDGWIYLAYTNDIDPPAPTAAPAPATGLAAAAGRGGGAPVRPSLTIFVRGKLSADNRWTNQETIYSFPNSLYTTGGAHYGTRIIFDGKGHLFFSIGERNVNTNAQPLNNPLGKIHRLNLDGSIPTDNPFYNTPGAEKSIWSYGHRNPEGLAFNPADGRLWESEHGPTTGDEINVIEPGHNYGWGLATMGSQPGMNMMTMNGASINTRFVTGTEPPVDYYVPPKSPSGINFYTGNKFPAWKGDLFVGMLGGQELHRLTVKGKEVLHEEVVFNQFGRVRQAVTGPDGYLYILLQNPTGGTSGEGLANSTPGRVIRLVPTKG